MKLLRAGSKNTWYAMIARCTQSWHKDFPRYGGRGITVAAAWMSYEQFLADMGEKPYKHSLERIDNNKGYFKENCKWATQLEQAANRSIYSTNKTRITGVCFVAQKSRWLASLERNTKVTRLYYGPDFFEACCARKSAENRYEARNG